MGKHVHLLGVFAGPMLGAFVDSADAESLQIRIGSTYLKFEGPVKCLSIFFSSSFKIRVNSSLRLIL